MAFGSDAFCFDVRMATCLLFCLTTDWPSVLVLLQYQSVPTLMDLVAAHAYDVSNDPRQTAKLDGPVWKYGFWPDIARKDLLQLKLCGQRVHARVTWLQ
jgi:hypothetical protein